MSANAGIPVTTQLVNTERREEAVKLRMQGFTWQQIANQLGYASQGHACTDVKRGLDRARKDFAVTVEQWRDLELQRLEDLERKARTVYDDYVTGTGTLGGSDDQRLAAMDRMLKVADRRARLLGLDQPVKHEVTGQVLYAVEGVNMDALK